MPIQRTELATRRKAFDRSSSKGCMILVISFVAVCLPIPFIPGDIWRGARGPLVEMLMLGYVFFLVAALFGGLFCSSRIAKRARRDCGLLCPECHLEFAFDVAMASGRCSLCNAVIVEGEPELRAGKVWQPVQRPDLELRQRKIRRAVLVASLPLFAILLFAAMAVQFEHPRNGSPPRQLSAEGVNVPFVIVLVGGGINFALIYWFERRGPRHYGLACPNCGASMDQGSGAVAMTTGRCGRCGATVVDGEPTIRSEAQRRAEVGAARRRLWKAAAIDFLAFVLLAGLLIAFVFVRRHFGDALPGWVWLLVLGPLNASFVLVTFAGVLFFIPALFMLHFQRKRPPRCPNCQAPVSDRTKQLTAITGRCGRCGAVIESGETPHRSPPAEQQGTGEC